VIIYDNTGKPLASSGFLNGEVPVPPMGVFEYVRENGENRLTWEPQAGVRSAIVVNKFTNDTGFGFVLVGRNMRETEKREADLMMKVGFGLLATLLLSFALDFLSDILRRRAMNPPAQPTETHSGTDSK